MTRRGEVLSPAPTRPTANSRSRICRSGCFDRRAGLPPRVGVAIGDQILDVAAAASSFDGLAADAAAACAAPTLDPLLSLGPPAWSALRLACRAALSAERGDERLRPASDADGARRAEAAGIDRDFTDFFASIFHATNAGRAFRPDNPLLPNYKYVPVAYHGRASSVRVERHAGSSGRAASANAPTKRCRATGRRAISISSSSSASTSACRPRSARPSRSVRRRSIFSASACSTTGRRATSRRWEYQPLGPFLGKNFATTVSPWVVTAEALAPFRTAAFAPPGRRSGAAALSRRRRGPAPQAASTSRSKPILLTAAMRRAGTAPLRLTRTSFATVYWTVAQMVAHHASNGCNLEIGDLVGSGTVSGPDKTAGAACWNCPRAAASRSLCRAAKSAVSSKTATRSFCAALRKSPVTRASASANAAPSYCRRLDTITPPAPVSPGAAAGKVGRPSAAILREIGEG